MLKSILSAIGAGMMAAFRFVGRTVTAPLTWFGGGGQAIPAPVPLPQPLDAEPKQDQSQIYDDIARAIMSWAADGILADQPQPLPPGLPVAIREWMPGLTRNECWNLMDADRMAVSSHVQRCFTLPGVRPVQPLPRVAEWPTEPERPESVGFAATALSELWQPPALSQRLDRLRRA
jgi:hypothetical protein